jgi:hypothetical protein
MGDDVGDVDNRDNGGDDGGYDTGDKFGKGDGGDAGG